jgi:S1-C subfamily serine protease
LGQASEVYNLSVVAGSINQKYRVQKSAIRLLGDNLDLAIIQFRSNHNYAVAKVAAPGSLQVDNTVYAAGFPLAQSGFTFNQCY